MKVAVIAFGTRGDVQPLVVLAGGIASRSPWCSEVVLVSHHQHGDLIKSLLGACADGSTASFAPVDSPAVIWKGTTGLDDAEARANLRQENACVKACEGAGLIIFNMFALEGYHLAEKMRVPSVVCHPYLTVAPIPSSFAGRMRRTYPRLFRRLNRLPDTPINITTGTSLSSPVVTLAESTSGPAPATWSLPNTGQQCSAAGTGDSCPDVEAIRGGRGRGQTAWTHVEHWMWPLFTDRWGAFRERLGLHPCPLEDVAALAGKGAGGAFAGIHVPLVSSAVDPTHLPQVLYLFSSLVVDTSPFWPESVRVCGYLHPPAARMAPGRRDPEEARISRSEREMPVRSSPNELQHQNPCEASVMAGDGRPVGIEVKAPDVAPCLPPGVESFLSTREDRPLYVGFGSMWDMCPPGYRLASALQVVLLGARQAGARCLVILPAREAAGAEEESFFGVEGGADSRVNELDSATDFVLKEIAASTGDDGLLVHTGPLAHEILLPRCSLAIHHGGSGTTAAVLRAGIPHVICPQQLDQLFWAERIRYLAVGSVMERSLFVGPESSSNMTRNALVGRAASAILSALTPQVKLRAACFGVKIRAENGLNNALDSLSVFLRRHRGPSRQAPPYLQTNTATASAPLDTAARRQTEMLTTNGAREVGGSARDCAGVDLVKEDQASDHATSGDCRLGRASSGKGGSDDRGDCPTLSERDVEGKLMLREMPNGMRVWCARQAEEETFFIYGEIFEDRTYVRMGLRVRDGDTIWDVGANVGLASIFFELETDAPDSLKVYAFEPLPLNNTALKRNTSEHCPGAVVLGYALGAHNEDGVYATFYPRMPGNSTLRPGEKERLQGGMGRTAPEASTLGGGTKNRKGVFFEDAEQVACNVRTVSWAMANLRVDAIDLLKIDVEGAELEALPHAAEQDVLLGVEDQDWPKIRQVVAEVHPVGDRVLRVCGLLRDRGFNVSTQALALDGTPLSPTHDAAGVARVAGEDIVRPTSSESASTAPTMASFLPAERSSPMPSDSVEAKATVGSTPSGYRKDAERCARTGLHDKPSTSGFEPARVNGGGDTAGKIAGDGDDDIGDAGGPRGSGQDEAVLVDMVFMVYATKL